MLSDVRSLNLKDFSLRPRRVHNDTKDVICILARTHRSCHSRVMSHIPAFVSRFKWYVTDVISGQIMAARIVWDHL